MTAVDLSRARAVVPGLLASGVVAVAAAFLAEHYQAPVMLFALLLGMAMNFLTDAGSRTRAGIEFAAQHVLRIGVALLGARITIDQIAALGWHPLAIVVTGVAATIPVSMLAARALGFRTLFGMLSGGATAICGASAALALAAALPAHPRKEQATLFTIVCVSALSTVAMIAYPLIVQALHLDPVQAGVFLGGTIHDVAQVVGAGYSLGRETGDVATVVKLMRVAMLLPVILVAAVISRSAGREPGAARPPLLPWFAVGFIVLAAVNSTGIVPPSVQQGLKTASQWSLVTAIAAIGMKSQLRQLAAVGLRPVLLVVGETVFLAALVAGLLHVL